MSPSPAPSDELGRLLGALCDGELTTAEAARLETLASQSPECRLLFLRYLELHGELYWEQAASAEAPAVPSGVSVPVRLRAALPPPQAAAAKSPWWRWLAAAACLALLVWVGIWLIGRLARHEAAAPQPDAAPQPGVPRDAERPSTPLVPPPGRHCVARLRQLVAAHPRLVHHFPLEGDPAERVRDARGQLHLIEVVMMAGSGRSRLTAVRGFDESTQALRFERAPGTGNASGIALQSEVDFQPPAEMTIELLLSYRAPPEPREEPICCAVATRQPGRRCGFLVAAVASGQWAQLLDAEADWTLGQRDFAFTPDQWYYVVTTFESRSDRTRLSGLVANLSRGEDRLTPIIVEQTVPGRPPASRLGIGKGFDEAMAPAYPWSGELDEVAVYDTLLSREEMESHLRALVAPKPP